MQDFYKAGRYFFAVSIIAFGIIQFTTSDFMSAFLPIRISSHSRIFLLYFFSSLFVFAGLMMLFNRTARGGALTAVLFAIFILYPGLINLISDPKNPGYWTVIAETLAICAGALIITGIFNRNTTAPDRALPFPKNKLVAGRILFACTLIVFAVQHFLYADYISTLIPTWIPLPVFWAYFVGIAFLAGSISLFVRIKTRLASALLGFMFLFWVFFLHAERVTANPQKETEWTSLFIALAFCGIFFAIASVSPRKPKHIHATHLK
jgi:uncharacterized membrane protein YphA (DoxX/SURF4 family)